MADFIPFMPSGARRAGAARMMAARLGRDPSFFVTHPIASQLVATGLGAAGYGLAGASLSPVKKALLAALPMLLTQTARRMEMGSIQRQYDDTKRKTRLRDIEGLDQLLNDASGGSSRLGTVGAYEAMRKRKYQDIGHLSEAADTLPLAALGTMTALNSGLNVPGMLATIPVTSVIDNRSADRLLKRADFSDQQSVPSIPMYLLAAGLAAGGQIASSLAAEKQLTEGENVPRGEWEGIAKSVSGLSPVTASAAGLRNAFYTRPSDARELKALAQLAMSDPYNVAKASPEVLRNRTGVIELMDKIRRNGIVVADPSYAKPSVLAHEGGHGRVHNDRGVAGFLQDNLYPYGNPISSLASVGSMAAGLASGSTLKGLLAGTGIGLLGGAAKVLPEAMASYHGNKALRDYKGGAYATPEDNKRQLAALATYAAFGVLPSMLSGAAGGWVSGRRRKKLQHNPDQH